MSTEKDLQYVDRDDRAADDMADVKSLDEDAAKLAGASPQAWRWKMLTRTDERAEMGYTQEMQRNFSVWSVLGVGFSLTNSWFGISAALTTGIRSGGPVLIVYGIILIFLISICVGVSLSELASALPNAGGQYFWANELAPKKYANFASYLTGWFAWAGSIFTSASVALAVGGALVGCYQLSHPELVVEQWMVVVGYEVVNAFCWFFNCYGKVLPTIAKVTLTTSLVSFFVILVAVPASAPQHQSATFVFATFFNQTGWNQNGMAFIVGLINTNWAFACLDCATHMAEEVAKPERMIPIAIMGTVGIGFVTSWFYSVSLFFSVADIDAVQLSATGVPVLEIFYQALPSKARAIVLEVLIILTGIGCQIASHTWQARLCWSFARDRGLPASNYLSKIHPTLDVPLRAHSVSCFIVGLLGLLYLGSITAFGSMVAACIVLLYVSYAIPVVCLLIKGRDNIRHGPFWMGSFGLFANVVLCTWTLFTIVMYSFPTLMPAEADTMNYVCVVYAIVIVIMLSYWFARGKSTFRRRDLRHEEADVVLRRASVVR
ncbi:MAG: hypothetical protein M1833_004543 [Piccolia ochrophora]|nr:MAG: hypothetical protein M1833_004543 [Piccolia ochrophora]